MATKDPFADHPALQTWRASLDEAEAAFKAEIRETKPVDGDEAIVVVLNATIRFWQTIGVANEAIGIQPDRAKLKAILLESWPASEIVDGQERAMATAIAYADGFRLAASGPKDKPIEVAMLVAAKTLGLDGKDPVEAVRKSIQRFRKSVRGTFLLELDPQTLAVQLVDAEEVLLKGLPGNNGRPRKARAPN